MKNIAYINQDLRKMIDDKLINTFSYSATLNHITDTVRVKVQDELIEDYSRCLIENIGKKTIDSAAYCDECQLFYKVYYVAEYNTQKSGRIQEMTDFVSGIVYKCRCGCYTFGDNDFFRFDEGHNTTGDGFPDLSDQTHTATLHFLINDQFYLRTRMDLAIAKVSEKFVYDSFNNILGGQNEI